MIRDFLEKHTFVKFFLSSGSSFLLDLLLFQLFLAVFKPLFQNNYIFFSTVCARIISSVYNYTINRLFVFQSQNSIRRTVFQYFLLCIVQMSVSAYSVTILYSFLKIKEVIIKTFVDVILFIVNFLIQKYLIFSDGNTAHKTN